MSKTLSCYLKQEETNDLVMHASTHWRSAQMMCLMRSKEKHSGLVQKGNVMVLDLLLTLCGKLCCSVIIQIPDSRLLTGSST